MTGTDEYEGSEQDIDDRVVGNEHQYSTRVSAEKYVILRYEHLYVESSNPCKEAGVVGADESRHIPQNCKADDGQEGYIGMYFVTIHLIPTKNSLPFSKCAYSHVSTCRILPDL